MTPATHQIGTVTATDPDAGAVIAYSLSGTDASFFAISALGVITPATAIRFSVAGKNQYSFTVEASSSGKSDTIAVVIDVVAGGTGLPDFSGCQPARKQRRGGPSGDDGRI